jgi:hypothetical protein
VLPVLPVSTVPTAPNIGNARWGFPGSLPMSHLRRPGGRPRSRASARRLLPAAATALLLLSACGGPPEASVDPGARPDLPLADTTAQPLLPPVTVWDVGEKEWVQLANFLPADKPVLVWFWAPH